MIEKSVDALAYLISIYKDPTKPENLRMDAAKVAIRYERPALASVEQAPQRDFIPLAERLKFYASRDHAEADAQANRGKKRASARALARSLTETIRLRAAPSGWLL